MCKNENKTFYQYLDSWRKDNPKQVYLRDDACDYTAEETFYIVNGLMKELTFMGLEKGQKVLLRATREVQTVFLFYALCSLGIVVVLSDCHEMAKQFIHEQSLDDIPYISNENGIWLLNDKHIISFDEGERDIMSPNDSFDDESVILFTSGTTSRRKGVVLSQAAFIVADLETVPLADYRHEDVSGVILPLYHVFGLCLFIACLITRHEAYFPNDIALPNLIHSLKKHHVSRLNGVPSLYLALTQELKKQNVVLEDLRIGLIGGSPSSEAMFARLEKELSMKLLIIYGMTESPGICCCSLTDTDHQRSQSVGKPYPSVQLQIMTCEDMDLDNGIGEIVFYKKHGMILSYLDEKNVLDENGFFHTGDLGRLDEEGYLHICGRCKDVIIRNGNNIVGKVIEDAFYSISGVLEACIVPQKDELAGEVPYLFLRLEADNQCDEIMRKARSKLKKIEYPAGVTLIPQFPKTATGKIDKLALTALANKKAVKKLN